MLGAGIAVRLKKNEQAVELAPAGGFQRGFDFSRVMAVVVDHGDVVDGAFDIEAAADSAKVCQSLANQLYRNTQIEGDSSGSSRIADIVDTGRMREAEKPEILAL